MNLGQLEVFVAIVDTGSLTEAAEVVGLTQSAVSHSLNRLEAELGVTLLERNRQGITLTRIGEDLLQHARNTLTQIEIIRQKAAHERGVSVGKLRFGCVPNVPPRLLAGVLRDFQQKYPDIEVVLFEGMPLELMQWLADGVLDVATVATTEGYSLSVPFVHDEIKVIVPRQHALATHPHIPFQALRGESLIGPRIEYGTLSMLLGMNSPTLPRLRYEVSTANTIFAMVREGMGVALMLNMLIDGDLLDVIAIPLAPPLHVQIHLAANVHSPAIDAFMMTASQWAKTHGFA